MESEEYISESTEDTIRIGRQLAPSLRAPVLVLLRGGLGAGKTTLAKGIIAGLGAAREEDVTSPTFTLVHEFRLPQGSGKVYHVDLYRVSSVADLETLGLTDVLSGTGIVLVEWPERLSWRSDWPAVDIQLESVADDRRRIRIVVDCGRAV
jgi:tRNA threonylcarbamoyladenosine biosynthesis protein TsaE